MTKLNLLLVEDNDTDALLVVRQLRKDGFEVDHLQVKTREEMESAFSRGGWDIVISDYSLPGFGGGEALELFKSKKTDIPFILVSGTVGEDIAVAIMKGGANDYLMKTHLNRLGPAVKRELAETEMKREKKRIESVLSQTEKRFQRLIQDLVVMVWLSNIDMTRFYIVNAAFEKIFGLPVGGNKPNPQLWIERVVEEDKLIVKNFQEDLSSRGMHSCEYRIRQQDDSIRWVFDQRYIVHGEGDEEDMVGGILADITEDKRAERELIQAKQAAEESSRLKSAMLQNMSHEFRTPMNGILGFSEMLHQELTDQSGKVMAEHILTSGKRLQNTLDSIMLYAQLEGGMNLKLSRVDLSSLVTRTSEAFREQIAGKGLNFETEVQQQLFLHSDETLIQKALCKIIENAVKFTSRGVVRITAGYEDENHETVTIRIRDTGIGIPKEKQKIIFEEFRQAEEGYNRPYEGSGLGLSIARKTIELLHGSIHVESEPGTGTEVILAIPSQTTGTGKTITDTIPTDSNGVKQAVLSTTPSPMILLVEDNDANIELVEMYLKKDFSLDVATNGEDSLEMARNKKYQVILMDINLGPGIDGIDAISEIRKMPEHIQTPIIAVTGYTFRNEKDYILSRGADYYLEKPFQKQVLLDLLRGILS